MNNGHFHSWERHSAQNVCSKFLLQNKEKVSWETVPTEGHTERRLKQRHMHLKRTLGTFDEQDSMHLKRRSEEKTAVEESLIDDESRFQSRSSSSLSSLSPASSSTERKKQVSSGSFTLRNTEQLQYEEGRPEVVRRRPPSNSEQARRETSSKKRFRRRNPRPNKDCKT